MKHQGQTGSDMTVIEIVGMMVVLVYDAFRRICYEILD